MAKDSAFPNLDLVGLHPKDIAGIKGGLTKREYFAAMAMQGCIAQSYGRRKFNEIAQDAIQIANEVIKELEDANS